MQSSRAIIQSPLLLNWSKHQPLLPQISPRPPSGNDATDREAPDGMLGQIFSRAETLLGRRSETSENDATDPEEPDLPGVSVVKPHDWDCTKIMVGFCVAAAALEVPLVSPHVPSQLSTAFTFHRLGVLLGFASFFVSSFINPKFVVTARVLQSLGKLFTVTAFLLLIIFPFPFCLKVTGWAFYAISLCALFQ